MSDYQQHKAFIEAKGTFHLECNPAIFNEEEYQFLRKYGHWCQALGSGQLQPYRAEQEQFVKVARGQCPPSTEHERTWWKYQARLKMERENPEKFQLNYQIKDSSFYTREQVKQLRKMMGSVNYQNRTK